MTKILIGLGAILTPFFVMPGVDVRDVKLTVASVVGVCLGLSGLRDGNIKPIKNVWFYLFLAYCLTSYIIAPNPTLSMMGMDVGNFWIWQPMFMFLVFGVAIIAVASAEYKYLDLHITLNIMMWCGVVMAVYVILQRLGIDQFFNNVGLDDIGRMAGFVGNPTHVSPFIGMLIPLALCYKKYPAAVIMAIAVWCTTSQVALGATIVGILTYYALKNRVLFWNILCTLTVGITLLSYALISERLPYEKFRNYMGDNQRFMVYEQVVKDVNSEPFKDSNARYPVTGWGMGNFKYTFHFAHYEDETFMRFQQAHNDYLELLYNTGIMGLFLFLAALFAFFRSKMQRFFNGGLCRIERALLAGFVVMCVTAAGTFIWQVGTTVFYTVVFVGLLNNKVIEEGGSI